MVRVKICGITSVADALEAVRSGADAIGLVFAESPRRVSPARAREIVKAVGPWIAAVGVFVDEEFGRMKRIVSECRLTAVQLHGSESEAYVKRISFCRVIKAFRVETSRDLPRVPRFRADAYLFDAKVPGLYGGTGRTFPWRILKSRKWERPAIVSGGLNPRNVASVVRLLKPYGVDVSSGVERSPGKKHAGRVKEFIKNAKKA